MVATKADDLPACSRSLAPEVRKALENGRRLQELLYEAGHRYLLLSAIEDQQALRPRGFRYGRCWMRR